MKKFLSVVLAVVMTMSLVTIAAGAKDFTDKSKVSYKEAVDVISGLGVVDGYTDGSFNPTATLTRGAAAKIICNLILGPSTAGSLGVTNAPFKDVPVSNTFAGYIAYCSQQGIISGYADGSFKPAATVTGYQFMKMLLGALGYDSSIEVFTGSNWTVSVAKLAVSIGLDKGNDNFVGSKAMTREEAALYAFNTMLATMVEYANKGNSITINGVTIAQGASKAEPIGTTATTDTYHSKDVAGNNNGTLQFYEMYFPKMVVDTSTYAQGLVNRTISYKGATISSAGSIGTVLATSTDGTSYSDLTSKSSSDYIGYAADSTVTYVYQDKAVSAAYPAGASGADEAAKLASNIATISAKAATKGEVVNFIDVDGNGKYDTVTFVEKTVEELAAAPTVKTSGSLTTVKIGSLASTDSDSIVYPSGLVKGDVVVYYVSQNGTTYVEKATQVSGDKITAYTSSKVTVNGTAYLVDGLVGTTAFDTLTANIGVSGYTFYLDAAGQICYAKTPDATASLTNTVFVSATDKTTSFGTDTYQAKAVYMDGTQANLTVSKVKNASTMTAVSSTATTTSSTDGVLASGTFYTYVKNSDSTYNLTKASYQTAALTDTEVVASNGVGKLDDTDYTYIVTGNAAQFLTKETVGGGATGTTTWATASLTATAQSVYGTSNTVFMYYDSSAKTYTAYTGIANALSYGMGGNVYIVKDSNNYALAVICTGAASTASSSAYDKVFVNSSATTTLDSNNVAVYTYTATVNGVTDKTISSYSALTKGSLYFVKEYDANGVVKADTAIIASSMDATAAESDTDVQAVSYNNGVMMVDGKAYLLANNVAVYLYDGDDASQITPEQAVNLDYNASASQSNPDAVTVVKTSSSDQTVSAVYIYIND